MTTLRTLEGTTTRLDEAVGELRQATAGDVLTGGDPGYAEARAVWNGVIDRHPAVIVRCADEDDVRRAVRFASEHRAPVTVRGGGHNVAGTALVDEGVVIDLTRMNGVEVDPEGRQLRAQGGATWADVDAAAQAHGLATPGGVVSDTGIGGLTLGGGIGWLRRKYGLSCDNLVGARVVTADGRGHEVDDARDPDLMWALRGGGGQLGVVTRMDYRLHPVGPDVATAFVLYHGDRTGEVLRAYHDYTTDLADDVSSFLICGTVPEEEDFPRDAWGEPYVMLMACADAAPETGERLVQPLRDLGEPLLDLSGTVPYLELQQSLDADYPSGMRYYWKSLYLPGLNEESMELAADWAARRPSPLSTLDIWHLGGAMARVPADATAFGDRSAPYLLGVEANWEDPDADDANIAWARDCVDAFDQVSTGRQYLNFPGFLEDGDGMLEEAHGHENWQRLTRLRERVDPAGLFDPESRTGHG